MPDYLSEIFSVEKDALERYIEEGDLVLNIGAGTGGGIMFVKHKAHRVIHAEIDFEILRCVKHDRNNLAICADLYHLPFKQKVFDAISCDWLMEHVARPQAAMSQMNSVLRENGRFLILTPNLFSLFCWVSLITPYWLKKMIRRRAFSEGFEKPHPVYYRFNRFGKINALFAKFGYRLISLRRMGGLFIYFRKGSLLYKLAVLYERLTDNILLRPTKMYLYLVYQKI